MDSMACQICKLALNVYTDPDGNREYVHSRPWIDRNHEPVPAALDLTDVKMACDFCPTDDTPITVYVGDEIEFQVDGNNNTYSPGWTACRRCDPLVFNGDLDVLLDHVWRVTDARVAASQDPAQAKARQEYVERVMRREWQKVVRTTAPRGRGKSVLSHQPVPEPDQPIETLVEQARERAMARLVNDPRAASLLTIDPSMRRDPRPLWAKFMSTIHTRQILLPVVRLTPSRIPKARDALMTAWTGAASKAAPGGEGEGLAAQLVAGLRDAEMQWLSSEFTALAGAAATNLDLSEHPLTGDYLPSPHGLVVWADMVAAMPGRPPGYADVIAVSWTRHGDSVIFVPYAQAEQLTPVPDEDLKELRRTVGWLVPVTAPFSVILDGSAIWDPWAADLVRTVAATWFLMTQPGVTDVSHATLDKGLHRAYSRAGRQPPSVRIVDLRHRAKAASVTGKTFSYSVRFMVSGFWRQQPYGPGRELRRPQYISPYLKGPEGAPLKLPDATPVVKVLR